MIRIVSRENAGRHVRGLYQMHRLRKEAFNDRLGWSVVVSDDLEVDEYDALHPVYVLSETDGRVEGMVPSAFVMLDHLPLTSNGKLGRTALAVPEASVSPASRMPPTPREEQLCALFAEILGLPRIGIDDNFFDLGGHSLLAISLGRRIRDALKPDFPLPGVYTAPVVRDLAARIESESATDDTPELSRDIGLAPQIRSADMPPPVEANRIFLTGATGFVGSHLLAALLRETKARIVCHVRAGDASAARLRLQRTLAQRQLSRAWKADRIDVVAGDLAAAELGLDDNASRFVREECDAVYHCGAQVDFLHPYAALKPANVDSVATLLDWTARGRPKRFHYVSTLGIIDPGSSRDPICEQDELPSWRGLVGGYSQSKWVGDTLARRAQARGLPVAIYRLGAVTGDRVHAICNETDLIWRLAKIYATLEAIPDLDLSLNMTPADDVARAIVALSRDGGSSDGIYHLASGEKLSLPGADLVPPSWWSEVDAPRPIVVVTQGTVQNGDLGQLVGPTLTALAGEPVTVVATTGGAPVEAIPVVLPVNARAAAFLPFDRLLPKAKVLVTNGGYGAVTHALSLGVPLVVAGDSEEKPEVAARVAWTGAGIDLRTGRPSARQVRDAVRAVLAWPQYRQRAQAIRDDFARHNALDHIAALIDDLAGGTAMRQAAAITLRDRPTAR